VLHSEQIGVLLIPSTFYLDIKTLAYFDAKHHCKVGKNFATLAIVSLAGARMHKCEPLSVKRACQRRCDFVVFRRIGDVEKRVGIGWGCLCEQGVNYADLATGWARTFGYYGKAFAGVRERILCQLHFGANYETGEYGWSTGLDMVKRSVDWQLRDLKTDCTDYGRRYEQPASQLLVAYFLYI